MGQKQKLFEDTAQVLEWMDDCVFREFVSGLVAERPQLIQRLMKEVGRVQRRQLAKPVGVARLKE